MWNAGLEESQAGIKIASRYINNLRYADDTTPVEESKEELKSLLTKVKEESEKAGLKLNIQKTKIMASSPITSWQIDGETMETVMDFIFLGSKITVDNDCSHEIKRRLLLGRKAMTNLDSVLKSRDMTLMTKVRYSQSYGFSSSHVQTWVGPWGRPSAEELMLSNCGAGKGSWESLGLQGDQTSQPWRKSVLNIHWKGWCWSWNSSIWLPDVKIWLIGKDPDAGKDWMWEEKGTTEDEMAGCHHWLNGHEFE